MSGQKSNTGITSQKHWSTLKDWNLASEPPPLWKLIRPLITCAVADAPVFDNIVAVQDAERLDFLLEVLHCGLFVGLQLLHSDQLARVITQWVITTKFNTAKVSLIKVGTVSVGNYWHTISYLNCEVLLCVFAASWAKPYFSQGWDVAQVPLLKQDLLLVVKTDVFPGWAMCDRLSSMKYDIVCNETTALRVLFE